MSELDNNRSVKAMVVFRKAMRTIDAHVSESYRQFGLTPTQFSVLDVLYAKGEMRISTLVDTILATSGNMTVVIKNMERNGWIYRKKNKKDGRVYNVGLTDDGIALIKQVLPVHIQQVEEAFQVLSDDEKLDMIETLKKFKQLNVD